MQITEFCTLSLICPLKYFIYYIYMFHPKYKSKSTIVLYYFTIFELLDFKINVNSIISLVKGGKKIDNNNTKFSHSSFFSNSAIRDGGGAEIAFLVLVPQATRGQNFFPRPILEDFPLVRDGSISGCGNSSSNLNQWRCWLH